MSIFLAVSMVPVYYDSIGTGSMVHPTFLDQIAVKNATGCMFLLMMEMMLANSLCNFLVFQVERPVFLREYSNNLYRIAPYYLTKIIIELPLIFLSPLLMQVIIYWLVGFRNSPQAFAMQYGALFVLAHCAAALGYMVSALAPNFPTAAKIGELFVIPMTLFGGLLVQMNTVFVWLRWLQWLSPVRFCFQALCIAQWGNSKWTRLIYVRDLGLGNTLSYWDCIVYLSVIAVLFHLSAVLTLYSRIKKF